MYERSAIVLERYFENYLDYRRECNLRDNFSNYCELVQKLEKYQTNYQKEYDAIQDYNESLKKIKAIQVAQEKLYRKSAKLEYNRNILFNTIDGKVEDLKKCIEKIEDDVVKNNEEMQQMKDKFVEALNDYNDKRFELSKAKRYKKMAENDYNEIYETARENFDGITEENIETAKGFSKYDDNESIIEVLQENGKNEKIPFNIDVITNVTPFGIEIAKHEVDAYLTIYDKMGKLLADIEEGTANIELHKKYLKNEKSKIDLILGIKEYIFQFLDYERMTVIHGKKSHNRLMSEACESFNADIIQINNLYELLLKEISNKATKKSYRDLYNKSYLTEIKEKEEKFKKEKNRVNLNTATLINTNYWRIEGIRAIYTVFYKIVSEVFGKEVEEFEIPKDVDEESENQTETENQTDYDEEEFDEKMEKLPEVKMPFKIKSINEETIENFNAEDDDSDDEIMKKFKSSVKEDKEEVEEDEDTEEEQEDEEESEIEVEEQNERREPVEEFDIFGDKYRDVAFPENDIIPKKLKEARKKSSKKEESYSEEIEEENLLDSVKVVKRKGKKQDEIEDIALTEEAEAKKGLMKKMRKITSVKKNFADDIW